MMKSSLHIAIIMDGNGRWAARRGLPRVAGHRAGVATVRRVVEAAPALGVSVLTLYAFSSDNWKRPPAEVSTLMGLLRRYLDSEAKECAERGVRLRLIGRRDRLPEAVQAAVERAEARTAAGAGLEVRLAVDYSSRDAILRAVARLDGSAPTRDSFGAWLDGPDVDLVIRTSGEQRLSDFLLWESAYAELYFTPVLWPDFTSAHLAEALDHFRRRERRFGGLPVAV